MRRAGSLWALGLMHSFTSHGVGFVGWGRIMPLSAGAVKSFAAAETVVLRWGISQRVLFHSGRNPGRALLHFAIVGSVCLREMKGGGCEGANSGDGDDLDLRGGDDQYPG